MRLSEWFDNRSNYIGYGSWVGRKPKGKNVDKAIEVACYLVTRSVAMATALLTSFEAFWTYGFRDRPPH